MQQDAMLTSDSRTTLIAYEYDDEDAEAAARIARLLANAGHGVDLWRFGKLVFSSSSADAAHRAH